MPRRPPWPAQKVWGCWARGLKRCRSCRQSRKAAPPRRPRPWRNRPLNLPHLRRNRLPNLPDKPPRTIGRRGKILAMRPPRREARQPLRLNYIRMRIS
nr:MAG TPA: hypothetical protein [Caudoviricetes sp.]